MVFTSQVLGCPSAEGSHPQSAPGHPETLFSLGVKRRRDRGWYITGHSSAPRPGALAPKGVVSQRGYVHTEAAAQMAGKGLFGNIQTAPRLQEKAAAQ